MTICDYRSGPGFSQFKSDLANGETSSYMSGYELAAAKAGKRAISDKAISSLEDALRLDSEPDSTYRRFLSTRIQQIKDTVRQHQYDYKIPVTFPASFGAVKGGAKRHQCEDDCETETPPRSKAKVNPPTIYQSWRVYNHRRSTAASSSDADGKSQDRTT